MGMIIIRDPGYCADYIRPHPNGLYGVYRLSYLGTGVPLVQFHGPENNATPELVLAALNQLQERFPLGAIGDYEILCTGHQLIVYDDDPASGSASAIQAPGWIAVSQRVWGELADTLGHELAHAMEERLSDAQREEFWRIVGQEPGDRYDRWERTPQERLAEYLSAALFGLPIDNRVLQFNDPDPTEATLQRIREWALPILGTGGQARITIGEQPGIILTIGSTTAIVDGREVQTDVAPVIIEGRTMVPLRFVAEHLGRRVDYEPKPGPVERALIY